MYHDTIHIIFDSAPNSSISFSYDFLISKSEHWKNHDSQYKYCEILKRFEEIGFNTDFLNFPDIKDQNQQVFCAYNYLTTRGTSELFFKAYKKSLNREEFDITFEYGSMVNEFFVPNNMNFYSSVLFVRKTSALNTLINRSVISGLIFYKQRELYQIIDAKGVLVNFSKISGLTEEDYTNAKDEFFSNKNVLQYLRKYKLQELMG